MKCPKCGSKNTVPILYGKPQIDDEIKQKLDRKELYLGGCDFAPKYHCFGCGADVASEPIIVSEQGKEDYRNMVTSIRFSDGGYFGGYSEISFEKTEDKVIYSYRPPTRYMLQGMKDDKSTEDADVLLQKHSAHCFGFQDRELPQKEWDRLLNRLYCKLYIHEWEHVYNDWSILDGEQWDLEIKLNNNRVINYHGSNAFPPYWKELWNTFKLFTKGA